MTIQEIADLLEWIAPVATGALCLAILPKWRGLLSAKFDMPPIVSSLLLMLHLCSLNVLVVVLLICLSY